VVIEEVHDVHGVDGIARKLLSELLEHYELAGGKRRADHRQPRRERFPGRCRRTPDPS